MQEEQKALIEDTESEGVKPKDLEKWELAKSVLKSAVVDLAIMDISEYNGERLDLRWHVFYQEFPNDT